LAQWIRSGSSAFDSACRIIYGPEFPAEGLVHVSSLTDDYYHFDEMSHTLEGKRSRRRYRLGDRVKVEVVRVDLNRRLFGFARV
jgi:exoribonuclease R